MLYLCNLIYICIYIYISIYIYIYIYVAIKRYIRLLWATVVGMCMFYFYNVVVYLEYTFVIG